MSAIRKVFVLLLPKRCESCGEKITAPRMTELLFAPIAILFFLQEVSTRNNGPGFSGFGDVVVLVLLAAAYFIYIVWVPLVPKEDAFDRGERLWWLTQHFLIFIGSAFIALPLWFLLTYDFHAATPSDTASVPGHDAAITALAWSPDGKTLASGSEDSTIKLWEPGGRLLRSLDSADEVTCLAWSPDGKILAGGSAADRGAYAIKLWDASSGQLLRKMKDSGTTVALAWSPDGGTLASANLDAADELWDAGNGKLLRTLSGPGTASVMGGLVDPGASVIWSPDTKIVAVASKMDGVKLWDAGSGRSLRSPSVHSHGSYAIVWNPDSNGLTIFGSRFYLWDINNQRLSQSRDCCRGAQREVWELSPGHRGLVVVHRHDLLASVAAWSPHGKTLAASEFNDVVKLWNPDDGQVVQTLEGHSGKISSMAWSPDGKTLASGSADHTIKVWNVSDGRLVSTLGHHVPDRIVVCPDGNAFNCQVQTIEDEKSGKQ